MGTDAAPMELVARFCKEAMIEKIVQDHLGPYEEHEEEMITYRRTKLGLILNENNHD